MRLCGDLMQRSIFKMTLRTIRTFLGRYLALMLIVMLSVGFFGGLKITRAAMYHTCETYLTEQNCFDFRVLSSLGFDADDVAAFGEIEGIADAEGSKQAELLFDSDGETDAYLAIAMPETVNLPSLTGGRMPRTSGECLADAHHFTEDDIGTTLTVSKDNTDTDAAQLSADTYTIVGLANTPVYLGVERGTTSIGSGTLRGFLYVPSDDFVSDIYTEVNLTLKQSAEIYSDAYETIVEEAETDVADMGTSLVQARYEAMLAAQNLTDAQAQAAGISEPACYVLTRDENNGYVSFENDAAIISGIANVFPLIFILIAILVCITTMTRMVDEERMQIGTLKALGFRNSAIRAKYFSYAGSAAVIGWALGFFLGTWGIPEVFWFAYRPLYDFAPLEYQFDLPLALGTFAATMAAILISTWWSCQKQLSPVPAELIRPSVLKHGKRILLECITLIWKRLSFLQKVILRNMLRYKRRLVMMLIGIGSCTALMLTAFGVRDSMIHISSLQYEDIQTYDLEASVEPESLPDVQQWADDAQADTVCAYTAYADLSRGDETVRSVHLVSFSENQCGEAWQFLDPQTGTELPMPENDTVLLSQKAAQTLDVSVGDTVTLAHDTSPEISVSISGIFQNYVYNYVVVPPGTLEDAWDTALSYDTLYLSGEVASDDILAQDGVVSVVQMDENQNRLDDALSCLDYIICMIVLFSGALAFLVTYNLTNINIAERIREIATVQVLGFYPGETDRYVLYENVLLSALAGAAGLLLGIAFHWFVMDSISIDMMDFQMRISPISFVLAFVLTLVFAGIVNLVMHRRIQRIEMAQALKAAE